jgi:hypothetical protein
VPERDHLFVERDDEIARLRTRAVAEAGEARRALLAATEQINERTLTCDRLRAVAEDVVASPRQDDIGRLRTARRQAALNDAMARGEMDLRAAREAASDAGLQVTLIHQRLLTDADAVDCYAREARAYFDRILLRHHRYHFEIGDRLRTAVPPVNEVLLAPLPGQPVVPPSEGGR